MTTDIVQDSALVENLQEQLRIKQRIVSAIKADGLRYYKPHEKQDLFHRAGLQYKRRAVFAGNRFGKSHCGAAEDCAWLRGERPWYDEDDPARRGGIPQRPVKGIVIAADWDKVDEIWTNQSGAFPGKLWRNLPTGFIKRTTRNHSGAIDMVECANGSVLRFDTVKSFVTNALGSESSDWDFAHFDEPLPEKMFKAITRGLVDRGGAFWFTLTALSEPWIVDKFYGDKFGGHPLPGTYAITGSIFDNKSLSDEAIAAYAADLNEDEKQCRLYGIPLALSGTIYKQFDPSVHVYTQIPAGWDAVNNPPRDYSIYLFIDPHPHTPNAALFCAVSPQQYRYYFDELFLAEPISKFVAAIHKILNGRRLCVCRLDKLAWTPDPVNRTIPAQEYRRLGLPVQPAVKDLHNGILRVQEVLAHRPTQVQFGAHLTRTLWEFRHYIWAGDGSNKPKDENDHMMENLYRCELGRPHWIDFEDHAAPISPIEFRETDLSLPSHKSDIMRGLEVY